MKFGTKVMFRCEDQYDPNDQHDPRALLGTLVGAKGTEVFIRLEQDDPGEGLSQKGYKKGQVVCCSRSAIVREALAEEILDWNGLLETLKQHTRDFEDRRRRDCEMWHKIKHIPFGPGSTYPF